ncbi:MAG: 30S ribosomal protein S17 [Cyanobacteria bacterium]|nr:30S ribosomal protein S17 [Cyanobacteriota bacterium]
MALKERVGTVVSDMGDRVRITETRPLSRTKRWAVAEILSPSSAS